MRRALLATLAILCGFLFPSVYQIANDSFTSARALPTLSGAKPVDIPNGDFSGDGLGEVGTPAANSEFDDPQQNVGTPPNDYDFATGNFYEWEVTGSPTIQFESPQGNYARLNSGQKIKTIDGFSVASNAQTLTFRAAAVTTGSFQFTVRVYYGAGFSSTSTKYISCSSNCTSWQTYAVDAVPYQGQSIKVGVERFQGDLKVDDVAVGSEVVSGGWTASDGSKVLVASGGPTGNYLQTSTAVTSPPIVLDPDAQNLEVNLKVQSSIGNFSVVVLSGPTYSTSTQVMTGNQTNSSTWSTKAFGVGRWAGQSIKVKVQPGGGSHVVLLDGFGVQKHVLPGWTPMSSTPAVQGNQGGKTYADQVGELWGPPMHVDGEGHWGNARGNWFRIEYMMKANFNPQGNDIGSTLRVYEAGVVSPWFTTAGKSTGDPYDPTGVWLEKYFFVYDPADPFTAHERDIQFWIHGWPLLEYLNNCNPYCEGAPAVGNIEVVAGPPDDKILEDPAPRPVIPPGLAPRIASMPVDTDDPVHVAFGNFTQTKTDLVVPGPGIPLAFTRSYSTQARSQTVGGWGPLGPKWSHNWEASLVQLYSNSNVRIRLPHGVGLNFYLAGGTWRSEGAFAGTLVHNVDGSWTLTTKEQYVYVFDSTGKWASVADRNGNLTTLGYDGSGRLTSITGAGGRSLTLAYNGSGRIASLTDDANRSVSYGYGSFADLTTITDVMGGTITYEYGQKHWLTKGTDAEGNVFVRNTYDTLGRVTQQLDAAGGVTTLEYSTPGDGATRVTDQRGKQITYYFDTKYKMTDVVDHDGGSSSVVYDANGNAAAKTNALGKTWQYTYDSRHNVLTATDPLSKVWTYTYNARNDVVTATDPQSRTTTYSYNSAGNLTSVTDASSKTTTFTLNSQGLVTAVTDPLSHSTSFGYNTAGDRTSVTNALNKTWTFAYDSAGRVTSATDPLSHSTSFTYNAANLVLTATNALAQATTYTYDANGNVLTVTDANNKTTTYAYNNKDQLTTITDPASGTWTFTYDAVGNLLTKTNPRGKTSSYTYDNLGRLTSETDPRSEVRSYAYDIGGRLTSRTDPKSQTVSYTYNDRNELTNITYPDLSFVSFAYSDAGARTQMVDSTGTTSYAYDDLYRLTSVTFPGSRTVGYTYDDAGRRMAITYPGGTNQVSYTYNAANQLTAVTDWNLATVGYAYDDAGRMTTKTLPASTGIVSSYTYDNADRLLGMAHVQNGQTTIASVDYTLDAVGNRLTRTDQQGLHTYSYDDLYRLTSVTYPGPSTTGYTFDAFGNRTSMTTGAGTTTYAYDDADRLTQVTPPVPAPPVPYTWDDNGNFTDRGNDTFTWDYEDRMTSATVNGTTTTFAYRGDGLRDSRTVGMNTTTFTWDINAGLPVVLDDGNQYVYGAGLESMIRGTGSYYYLADGLGSTMAVVDSAGAVQKSYTYDVYGKPTATGSLGNEFDFAGQQTDPSTGLQYLRARYMDPETGTFLSREPLATSSRWLGNPFNYVENNPSRFLDPSGLRLCDIDSCEEEPRLPVAPERLPLDQPTPEVPNVVKLTPNLHISDIAVSLVGEYIVGSIGTFKFAIKRGSRDNIVELRTDDDPEEVAEALYEQLMAGGEEGWSVQYSGGRSGKTHDGLFAGLRKAKDGTWTVDVENPYGDGNVKFKILPRLPK